MLPSLRRIFLVTSPNSEVDELKEELKDAKDRISSQSRRLKEQAKEHSLAMSQLTKQLEAERKQTERLKALLAKTGHRRDKNPDFEKAVYATECVPFALNLRLVVLNQVVRTSLYSSTAPTTIRLCRFDYIDERLNSKMQFRYTQISWKW